MKRLELSDIAAGTVKWHRALGRQFGCFLNKKKLNILLPDDLAIVLLGIYPKELQTCPHKNLHPDVYSTVTHNRQPLEATDMSYKQAMDKLRSIQAMEDYSEPKRNEL